MEPTDVNIEELKFDDSFPEPFREKWNSTLDEMSQLKDIDEREINNWEGLLRGRAQVWEENMNRILRKNGKPMRISIEIVDGDIKIDSIEL